MPWSDSAALLTFAWKFSHTPVSRFQERLICYAYWPWDPKGIPKLRNKAKTKRAVLVTSSAAPALLGRLMMHSVGSLKKIADVVGAKCVGTLYLGLAGDREPKLSDSAIKKAKALGKKLAS